MPFATYIASKFSKILPYFEKISKKIALCNIYSTNFENFALFRKDFEKNALYETDIALFWKITQFEENEIKKTKQKNNLNEQTVKMIILIFSTPKRINTFAVHLSRPI